MKTAELSWMSRQAAIGQTVDFWPVLLMSNTADEGAAPRIWEGNEAAWETQFHWHMESKWSTSLTETLIY